MDDFNLSCQIVKGGFSTHSHLHALKRNNIDKILSSASLKDVSNIVVVFFL